MFENLERYFTQ